jgi:hypothetical protein
MATTDCGVGRHEVGLGPSSTVYLTGAPYAQTAAIHPSELGPLAGQALGTASAQERTGTCWPGTLWDLPTKRDRFRHQISAD